MKKKPTSKHLRSRNLCPKPNLVITFWASLWLISSKDLILIFYIWLSNTTTEVSMKKKSNLNDTLLLLLGIWPKLYDFSIMEHFALVYLTMLAPHSKTLRSRMRMAEFLLLLTNPWMPSSTIHSLIRNGISFMWNNWTHCQWKLTG